MERAACAVATTRGHPLRGTQDRRTRFGASRAGRAAGDAAHAKADSLEEQETHLSRSAALGNRRSASSRLPSLPFPFRRSSRFHCVHDTVSGCTRQYQQVLVSLGNLGPSAGAWTPLHLAPTKTIFCRQSAVLQQDGPLETSLRRRTALPCHSTHCTVSPAAFQEAPS